MVTDANGPAGRRGRFDRFPRLWPLQDRPEFGRVDFQESAQLREPKVGGSCRNGATTALEGENVYKVKAKVGDGEKYLPVEITVQVRGKEEPGTVILSNRQPEVGVKLTTTLADGDIRGLRTPDWQWEVESDTGSGVFEEIDEAVNAAYTPRAGDEGKKLKVIAQYEDSHGTDYAEVSRESEFAVRAAPSSNVAPMFRDTDEDD